MGGGGMRQNNLSGRSLHSFVEQFSNKGTLVLHCNEGSSTFHSTLMMTSTQVVETSVTTAYNSPSQDYTHPDNQTTPLQVVTLIICIVLQVLLDLGKLDLSQPVTEW